MNKIVGCGMYDEGQPGPVTGACCYTIDGTWDFGTIKSHIPDSAWKKIAPPPLETPIPLKRRAAQRWNSFLDKLKL